MPIVRVFLYKNSVVDHPEWGKVLGDIRLNKSDKLVPMELYVKVYEDELKKMFKIAKMIGYCHILEILQSIYNYYNGDKNPLIAISAKAFVNKHHIHTTMTIGDMIQIDDDTYIMTGEGFMKRTSDDKLENIDNWKVIYNLHTDKFEDEPKYN
jgi:hypothetical protein